MNGTPAVDPRTGDGVGVNGSGSGTPFPEDIWRAFEATFASDAQGVLDERHAQEKFRSGHGLAMYWETLARWIPQRARRGRGSNLGPAAC